MPEPCPQKTFLPLKTRISAFSCLISPVLVQFWQSFLSNQAQAPRHLRPVDTYEWKKRKAFLHADRALEKTAPAPQTAGSTGHRKNSDLR